MCVCWKFVIESVKLITWNSSGYLENLNKIALLIYLPLKVISTRENNSFKKSRTNKKRLFSDAFENMNFFYPTEDDEQEKKVSKSSRRTPPPIPARRTSASSTSVPPPLPAPPRRDSRKGRKRPNYLDQSVGAQLFPTERHLSVLGLHFFYLFLLFLILERRNFAKFYFHYWVWL